MDGDNVPQDGAGHGTASAGIIAAIPDNKLGITPICWNCQIMNLRVLNEKIKGPVSGFVKVSIKVDSLRQIERGGGTEQRNRKE